MAAGNGTMLVLKSLAWLRVPQGGGVGERKRRRTTMFRRKAAASGTMLVLKSLGVNQRGRHPLALLPHSPDHRSRSGTSIATSTWIWMTHRHSLPWAFETMGRTSPNPSSTPAVERCGIRCNRPQHRPHHPARQRHCRQAPAAAWWQVAPPPPHRRRRWIVPSTVPAAGGEHHPIGLKHLQRR